MVTICFTYFKSLSLENLRAALYSVRQQDFSQVQSLIVVDNDTTETLTEIHNVVKEFAFPVSTVVLSYKHRDASRTQSWSTNTTVRQAKTPWVFYTRADYLLGFDILSKFVTVIKSKPDTWDGFITSNGSHLGSSISSVEQTNWRQDGPSILGGSEYDHTSIDSGVWMARRETFDRAGGLDESLTAWGHAQTLFQHRVYQLGTEFIRIPETLFWHPYHSGLRDLGLAHQQLQNQGVNLRELWNRYEGRNPY